MILIRLSILYLDIIIFKRSENMLHFDYWIEFMVFVFILLSLDLLVFNKKNHEVKLKEALLWSAFWIALALGFGLVINFQLGKESMMQYYAAYIMEKSLSLDNLFVFVLVFSYFKVPPQYHHRILFWGIIGALLMRFLFIFLGVALIQEFTWIFYIFGAILIYSAYKMIKEQDKEIHPEKNVLIRVFRKFMPVTTDFGNGKFFVKIDQKRHATVLFLVLIFIETTDVIFAVDSIPAVLAITQNSYIAYTSNIMAILGLRALFFAIAGVIKYFRYLNYGLSLILAYVGIKMLLFHYIHIPVEVSLLIVAGILAISIIFSVLVKPKDKLSV